MQLIKALRYRWPASIAFVGAGGKTTALFKVGQELLARQEDLKPNKTILLTTTTHLGAWQTRGADHWQIINTPEDILYFRQDLPKGIILLTGDQAGDRLNGLQMELMDGVQQLAKECDLPLLIEADGAHMVPLKAPAEDEPVIPQFVDIVVVVAGLKGLGRPLVDAWVHRSKLFGELAGIYNGDVVTIQALARVFLSERGGLKNIPDHARRIALLNQADNKELQSQAHILAKQIIASYDSVITSALNPQHPSNDYQGIESSGTESGIYSVLENTAGIILAAGGSSRFGQPKQLLPWKGQPLIRHVAQAAIRAGLQPVVVVLGSFADEIKLAIKDLPLRIVVNIDWAMGMSSSIKTGLHALPKNTGAALFLQADQPQITSKLIESLVETHQSSLYPIIAPQIHGQRGNPVIFDVSTFPELLMLEGDVGGRALFQRYPPHFFKWDGENLLLDIDTPDDYQKLLLINMENET